MLQIDRAYVSIALVFAVAGMLLGLYMGIAGDNSLLTVHVAFLLPGFVTLAIYGMLFRLWPALATAPLARLQFWLGAVGSAGLVVGAYFFVTRGHVPLAAIASLLAIAAAALMCWLFWDKTRATI